VYRHQYWFIDLRYLVRRSGQWVYSLCIIEGYSRMILAGMAADHQDELVVLQLLHAALAAYGCPEGIVSDNGSVYTAAVYRELLQALQIDACYIDKGQAWQNLIEAQFKIQLRLADAHFAQASSREEIQVRHAAFVELFNTTPHWAHRTREDGCRTPEAVLAGAHGRRVTLDALRRVFRHLHFPRMVNRHGCVRVQHFSLYAEQGLAKRSVSVWIYEDRLHIEYQQSLLAHYSCTMARRHSLPSRTRSSTARPLLRRNWSSSSWMRRNGSRYGNTRPTSGARCSGRWPGSSRWTSNLSCGSACSDHSLGKNCFPNTSHVMWPGPCVSIGRLRMASFMYVM
jgi:hypothetical protein